VRGLSAFTPVKEGLVSNSLGGGAPDLSVLIGSGFGVSVLLLALVEWLRRTFATRADLDRVAAKCTALESLFLQVREAADEARERASALQAEQKHQWERIAEQVIRPLERITKRLDSVCEAQAIQSTALAYLTKRFDQADAWRDAIHIAPEKKP
jgi:hypothetical protein